MTEAQARAAGLSEQDIAALKLSKGNHKGREEGHCLLEVVSMFAGEDFGDSPQCVDPVLAAFGRTWNDDLPSDEDREQLKRYIPLLPGTNQGEALSLRRSWMAGDWLIRTCLPTWLELTPALAEHAAQLRALAPITDQQGLDLARAALDHASRGAAAARAAAWDAARAAARAAAQLAPADEVYAVAYKAVMDVLGPTSKRLQEDAHALYLRMINERATDAAEQDQAEA